MTTTDEYVPSDEELYEQIAKRRYEYDYTSPWEHLAPTPRRLLMQAARNTMEPIIARVRRDAWDACYRQMVTAPARGVTVTWESNPYAPERRVTQ